MKVYPFRIPKKPQENIVLQIDKCFTFFDRLHQHEEIQISHIVKGKGKLIVGNGIHTFNTGDTFAIGSNVPHLFQSTVSEFESHMISLFFLPEAFGKEFFALPEMKEIQPLLAVLPYGISITSISNEFTNRFKLLDDSDKFKLFKSLLDVLIEIARQPRTVLSDRLYPKTLSNNQGHRLQLVFDHVMKNFHQEIKLQTVADMIYMSPNAFCRFFKKRSNKSFLTFVTEVRIAHASQLLTDNPDLSISEIAAQSGFNTISNFNKQFKSIKGENPSTYKRTMILV